jgi:hypothetical protein
MILNKLLFLFISKKIEQKCLRITIFFYFFQMIFNIKQNKVRPREKEMSKKKL